MIFKKIDLIFEIGSLVACYRYDFPPLNNNNNITQQTMFISKNIFLLTYQQRNESAFGKILKINLRQCHISQAALVSSFAIKLLQYPSGSELVRER